MSCLKKIGLILWKNWLFRRRHYVMTLFEISFPILFALSIFLYHQKGIRNEANFNSNFTDYEAYDLMAAIKTRSNNVSYLLYYPKTSVALDLLKYIDNRKVKFEGVENEKEIETWRLKSNIYEENLLGAVVFEGLNEDGSLFTDKLKYKIRMKSYWYTNELEAVVHAPGPYPESVYHENSNFIAIQHAIALRIIEIKSGKTDLLNNYLVTAESFPFPPYYDDKGFYVKVINILPFLIVLSYIFTAVITVRRIVREKEIGIMELVDFVGIPSFVQWFAWFFSSFIMMGISAFIIVSILCFKSDVKDLAIFEKSSSVLIYIVFLLYIASAVCFCFFISSLFRNPTFAASATILIWLLSLYLPYYSFVERYKQLRSVHKMLFALLPNTAFGWALKIIAGYEAQNEGLRWYNLRNTLRGDNIAMTDILFVMIIDVFLYSLLTWYINNVYPGLHGASKPWNFLFMKSFWTNEDVIRRKKSTDFVLDEDKFEKEPFGMKPCIVIKNLSKCYDCLKTGQVAVNNVSLNIYQGQMTALFGHKGAGKTTIISILTGMFPPSKGTAYIKGHNIRTEIEDCRENVGFCPQQNMLFDSVTVEEHLRFFGTLKIDSLPELNAEVTGIMQKLKLSVEKNTIVANLSVGMKRKLSLGIALIGGPRIIILDEPTTGMSHGARKAVWDFLKEIRSGRCILVSTNLTEEADVLGDRVAIIKNGRLECCGSPLFLKNRYGAGYNLNINIDSVLNTNEISTIVHQHVSSSILRRTNGSELSFLLPADKSSLFPRLFESLEAKSGSLGIKNLGLSVVTMDEAFLKVGEITETDANLGNVNKHSISSVITIKSSDKCDIPEKNTGISLKFQQFYGLLLKRFYYTRHHLKLITLQFLLPLLTSVLFIYLNNTQKIRQFITESPHLMDLTQYPQCIAFLSNETNTDTNLSPFYRSTFPSKCIVRDEDDPLNYLKETSRNNFYSFRDEILFGTAFYSDDDVRYNIEIWINNHFHHTLPTALNIIHNTMLRFATNNENIFISVENAPLKNYEKNLNFNDKTGNIRPILIGVLIPIGISFLTASFIIFSIHERVTKSKHIQFMAGVGGILFWFTAIVWDLFICFIVCSVVTIFFVSMDKSNIFNCDNLGIVLLLLLLYCWASIPFSYFNSFLFRLPSAGFATVVVINMATGFIFGIWQFDNEMLKETKDWKWLFVLVPNFAATVAFMKIAHIGNLNNFCVDKNQCVLESVCKRMSGPRPLLQCCPDVCGDFCFKKSNYLTWNWPGLSHELLILGLIGLFYMILICFIESSYFYNLCHAVNQLFTQCQQTNEYSLIRSANTMDSDVFAERERMRTATLRKNAIKSDYLLVSDLSKYFKNFAAVDGLNFGVENGSCLGLLGINGAGKTTTIQQLTGDLLIDFGDAVIREFSIIQNKFQYLSNIGYCPQVDALLDRLTGTEILHVFSNLYGIAKSEIADTVDEAILKFDLVNHSDKLILVYSGEAKRKLSVALAFIGHPAVVFLDEPTTGVDQNGKRKIWNAIKERINVGTTIVLASKSLEECEVVCSRVGILVNGQFQCLGAIPNLRNKFCHGFIILAKLKQVDGSIQDNENNQNELQSYIENKFPSAVLNDVFQGVLEFHLKAPNKKLTELFVVMETAKDRFHLEDYSITQATLEQVFQSFTRKQIIIA